MIAGNLAFVSGPWLRSLVTGRDEPAGRPGAATTAPARAAGRRWRWSTAADPDRVVEPVDLTAVDVATDPPEPDPARPACRRCTWSGPTAGSFVGYDAVVVPGRWMPLFWPLALDRIAAGGGAGWAAAFTMRMAASRPRDVPCTDEVCGIHPVRSRALGRDDDRARPREKGPMRIKPGRPHARRR